MSNHNIDQKDLVSVVVPIYKVEKYLCRCVDSILQQTYKNLDIVLVNDGSPDKCGEICDLYASKDGRIKVIHKSNGGLSEARNAGTMAARGKYITYIDSDDYVSSDYIEYLYKGIIQYGADVSCCEYIRTKNDSVDFELASKEEKDLVFLGSNALIAAYRDGYGILLTIAWGKMFKTATMCEHLFPVGRINEDDAVVYQVVFESQKVYLGTKCCYAYYVNSNGIMATKGSDFSEDYVLALEERISYFERNQEDELLNYAHNLLMDYLVCQCITSRSDNLPFLFNYMKKYRNAKGRTLINRVKCAICIYIPILIKIKRKIHKWFNG